MALPCLGGRRRRQWCGRQPAAAAGAARAGTQVGRRQWSSSALWIDAAPCIHVFRRVIVSAQQRPIPTRLCSDEAEILQQLDTFQRQTDTIRRALGGGSGAGIDAESGLEPRQLASSLAAAASEWGGPEGTPLRQHPAGLRGAGYTPGPGMRGGTDLFEGLPPSPAALAARSWAQQQQQQQQHANRHVQHAGHHCHDGPQQQAVQPPAAAQGSVAAAPPGHQRQQQQQLEQRPRSPIGPDVRHTKKSAAAAAAGTSSALQRLKSRRPASAGAQAAEAPPPPAALPSPQYSQLQAPSESLPLLPAQRQQQEQQQQQQQQAASPWQEPALDVPVQQAPAEVAPEPPAPQLPPDSNAALVAEVRQLRAKLLQSLQKHAPELEAAGVSSLLAPTSLTAARSSAGASKLLASVRQQAEPEAAGSPGSNWRLAAGVGDASPPATTACSGGMFRLTDQSSFGGEAWPPATGIASSSKFRLTDDSGIGAELGGGRQRLSDLSGSFGGAGGFAGMGSSLGGTPASVLCSGGANLASLDVGSSGFSLEAFEAQTEALRRQLAGL